MLGRIQWARGFARSPAGYFNPKSGGYGPPLTFRTIVLANQQLSVRPAAEIPGPLSLPLLGTIYKYLPGGEYDFKQSIPTALKKFSKFGPICREEFGTGQFVIQLFDPEDFQTVFKHEGKYPRRLPLEAVAHYYKTRNIKEMATSEGEEWQEFRSKVQSYMLKMTNVETYVPLQDPVADDFVALMKAKRRDDGEIPDYLNELSKWSMESIGVVCFDTRLKTLENDLGSNSKESQFIRHVNEFFRIFGKTIFTWFIHKHGTPTYRQMESALDHIWAVAERYVEQAAENLLRDEKGLLADKSGTLLARLTSNPAVTRQEVTTIMFSLFVAGVESTANSMCFNLYQLAKNPNKQELIFREIRDHISHGQPTTADSLRQLKLLKAAVRETTRLMPTASVSSRILDHDIVVKGYKIPAGYGIIMNHGAASRLPQFFPEPDRFLPERWLRSGSGVTREQHHPFLALQFGFGPRSCIGRRFAEQELHLGLVKILQHFRVEYLEGEEMGMEMRGLEKPTEPIRFKFVDRGE